LDFRQELSYPEPSVETAADEFTLALALIHMPPLVAERFVAMLDKYAFSSEHKAKFFASVLQAAISHAPTYGMESISLLVDKGYFNLSEGPIPVPGTPPPHARHQVDRICMAIASLFVPHETFWAWLVKNPLRGWPDGSFKDAFKIIVGIHKAQRDSDAKDAWVKERVGVKRAPRQIIGSTGVPMLEATSHALSRKGISSAAQALIMQGLVGKQRGIFRLAGDRSAAYNGIAQALRSNVDQ
jgi:hypothetical protein